MSATAASDVCQCGDLSDEHAQGGSCSCCACGGLTVYSGDPSTVLQPLCPTDGVPAAYGGGSEQWVCKVCRRQVH